MKAAIRTTAVLGLLVGLAAVPGASGLSGQTPATSSSAKQEVFCEGLSAGQLCLSGTVDVLKLDGDKRQQWTGAARRYNQAVSAATKQLLAEAKTTLSPEEFAKVEKWFDKNLNLLLNQILLGNNP